MPFCLECERSSPVSGEYCPYCGSKRLTRIEQRGFNWVPKPTAQERSQTKTPSDDESDQRGQQATATGESKTSSDVAISSFPEIPPKPTEESMREVMEEAAARSREAEAVVRSKNQLILEGQARRRKERSRRSSGISLGRSIKMFVLVLVVPVTIYLVQSKNLLQDISDSMRGQELTGLSMTAQVGWYDFTKGKIRDVNGLYGDENSKPPKLGLKNCQSMSFLLKKRFVCGYLLTLKNDSQKELDLSKLGPFILAQDNDGIFYPQAQTSSPATFGIFFLAPGTRIWFYTMFEVPKGKTIAKIIFSNSADGSEVSRAFKIIAAPHGTPTTTKTSNPIKQTPALSAAIPTEDPPTPTDNSIVPTDAPAVETSPWVREVSTMSFGKTLYSLLHVALQLFSR